MAEVLAAAFCARATGAITVEDGQSERRLFVRYGVPVGVEIAGGVRAFGQFLLERGLLDHDALERLTHASGEQQRKFGELLVAEGKLVPEQLRRQRIDHHQAALVQLCVQREGRYELRGWERPPDWTEGLQLDP